MLDAIWGIEKAALIAVKVCFIPLIWNVASPTKNHPTPHKKSDIISTTCFSILYSHLKKNISSR